MAVLSSVKSALATSTITVDMLVVRLLVVLSA